MRSFEVQTLSLEKNGNLILKDLSFSIPEGALTVLIGPNGAGKSSLLRCLAGLETEYSGKILFRARDLRRMSQAERTQTLTWCPAETRLAFSYSCLELVCMGRFPVHKGYPGAKDYELSREAMRKLGLEKMCERSTEFLSSGEFRKLMIARVLASQNSVFLLDEPDAHLDIACVFEVLSFLKSLTRKGFTIVLSLHDLHLASQYADHLLLLQGGCNIKEGSLSEIFTQDLIYQAFGVGLGSVRTAFDEVERIFFHPVQLSEGAIDDK